MQAVQQVMAVIGGAIGIVTALLTMYAKYLDVKKAAEDRAGATAAASAVAAQPMAPPMSLRPDEPPATTPPPVMYARPAQDPASLERVRGIVRAPAMALMIAGGLGLFGNLATAGYAYVDEFVTPLNDQTKERKQLEAARGAEVGGFPQQPGAGRLDSPQAIAVMTAFMLLSFSLASAIAIWAGYGMLRLKSYWLSVAGSIAVMPGACMCCFAGFPVGIWSLIVLFRPDVAAAFR